MTRRLDPFTLALGGHVLVPMTHPDGYTGPQLYRCTRCHGTLPRWAITSGFLAVMLGRFCPELVPALPPTTYRARPAAS